MTKISPEQTAELQARADSIAFSDNGSQSARALPYRTLREIAEDPIPAPPVQINTVCREGEVGILTGPANRLKSRTGAALAVAVASGKAALGKFAIERPGKALIIQNEIHPGVYDQRMMHYANTEADWTNNLLIISRENFRMDVEGMLRLDTLMTQEKITFAVLDPISEMWPLDAGFDENRAPDVTLVIERLKALRDKGRTLLFVHHDPKDADRKARGSGRLIDAPDLRIYLSKANKKGMETARAKVRIESRTLPPPDEFDVVLGSDGSLRHEAASITDEQEETLEVVQRMGRPTTADVQIALRLEYEAAYGRLARLREKGKVKSKGSRPTRWTVR